ncbi:MAG TPA: H-X9-DG-CTERM domain-containing protein [Planctomycetaceae bacterium]|nr:H-X9-DG-CTERM domain-containing protein [Planctomycetaceae bacterium]
MIVNLGFHSQHSGGGFFLWADGAVKFMNENISLEVYRAVGSIDGREAVQLP